MPCSTAATKPAPAARLRWAYQRAACRASASARTWRSTGSGSIDFRPELLARLVPRDHGGPPAADVRDAPGQFRVGVLGLGWQRLQESRRQLTPLLFRKL